MLPIIPLIVTGGLIAAALGKKRRKKIVQSVFRLEGKYQKLIQNSLDSKLLGKKHVQQLQVLNKGLKREQHTQEKRINRVILLGVSSLGLVGLSSLTALPVLPLIFPIALYNLWPVVSEGWNIAFHERRFSLIHIVLVFLLSMWLSGSYLIAILSSLIINVNRKVIFLSQAVARSSLTNLLGEAPQKVWIMIDGAEFEIPFEELQVGQILVLQAGQAIPIDGKVVHGSATVDQHRLTGESQPAEKVIGNTVFASTLLLSGHIHVQVEKAGGDALAAKIGSVLNKTVEYQKTRLAEQYAFFESTRWPTVIGGVAGFIIGGPIAGLAMLGCNFTSNMVALNSLTLLNALKSGASQGVLIKDGMILETLSKIDTIVFDKTGTLTTGQPQIKEIHCIGDYTSAEVLSLAAGAEQHQSHPIAKAILSEAFEQSLEIPEIDEADYQLGLGLFVKIQGQALHVGSERFLVAENIHSPQCLESIKLDAHSQGNALIFIAVDQQVIGVIELTVTVRPEVKRTINWLKQQGLEVYILSGDQEEPTRHLSEELGMNGYFANTLPEQKAQQIQALQEQGRQVCFIGDGINDAIALQQSDVSISLGGATTIATDVAQVIIMNDQLDQLIVLWELAKSFEKTLSTNNRLANKMSVVSAVGVMLFPFKFWTVELMCLSNFSIGIKIAKSPLLKKENANLRPLLLKEDKN